MRAGNPNDKGLRELTSEQLSMLCKALEDAINPDDLEQMMLFRMKERLRNIPQANTYKGQILKVVEWSESKGKTRRLVIEASLENPGNPQLRQFVRDHLQVLLELDTLPFEENLLPSLLNALTPIDDFSGIVWLACTQTLSDIETSLPDLKANLQNSELCNAAKWLMLLELFLKTWERTSEARLYIVLFVQNLANLERGNRKSVLEQWLDGLPESLRPASVELESGAHLERSLDKALARGLLSRFLIAVEPLETVEHKYGVNGYVVTCLGDGECYKKFEGIELTPPKAAEKEADPSQAQPYYTFEQIENAVPDWLEKAEEVIFNRSIDIQKQYHLESPPASKIAVEFWLPFEYLQATTEIWKIYGRLRRNRRILGQRLGQRYRVVVRSYDRFSNPGAINSLLATWEKVKLPLGAVSQEWIPPGGWDLQEKVHQTTLGLSMTCPICDRQYERQREALFEWMLEKAIPLVLWSRCVNLDENRKIKLQQRMQEWLTTADPNQLDEFFETIKQARAEACDNQLALWCDEPDRLEELRDFRKSGRLSA